jgi:glutamate-1-semialdehyde aminotransferase
VNIDSGKSTSSTDVSSERENDRNLRARALVVIPGGMYGHPNMRPLLPEYSQFMASGQGARVIDVDGREFVDLMCSWGPVILGHRHPVVEEAAARQASLGDCLNGPSPGPSRPPTASSEKDLRITTN